MKLLFDQNLSTRLPNQLEDIFPGSLHVREVGLIKATDTLIWEYARQHELILISKTLTSIKDRSFSAPHLK